MNGFGALGRFLVLIVILVLIANGAGLLPSKGTGLGSIDVAELLEVKAAMAAPAAIQLGDIAFSEDVDANDQPVDSQTEFNSRTERIWASFSYRDNGGAKLSYLIRANGADWQSGDLDCCSDQAGRFAFPIERPSGRDLGGASYDVRIYDGDTELANGGFGVKGTKAFD